MALVISPAVASELSEEQIKQIQQDAIEAYSKREFQQASNDISKILEALPNDPVWLEARAQILVDGKNFEQALEDYNVALKYTEDDDYSQKARLFSGRALAYEGLYQWKSALNDYNEALELAYAAGFKPDPYVINSRGNVLNSLGEYELARDEYKLSATLFIQSYGFKDKSGGSRARLDGYTYAETNATLMSVQLGQFDEALKAMEAVAKKAPSNSDTRAALAAMYWHKGEETKAERAWDYACTKVTSGCSKYKDRDWVQRIRRWPPVMVDMLDDFLQLKTQQS